MVPAGDRHQIRCRHGCGPSSPAAPGASARGPGDSTAIGRAGSTWAHAAATSEATQTLGRKAAVDLLHRSAEDGTLRWSNWTLYLDYDDEKKTYPTL